MRKLFKKSLACILTAIICVSLCVVAVPASAATPAYSTLAVEAKAGETVDVTFNVSNFADVKGAQIKFFLPEVVASIEAVKCNAGELVPYADGEGNYEIDAEAKSIKLIALFGYEDELAAVDTLVLTATVVIAEDAAVGTYNYAAPEIKLANAAGYIEATGAFGKFEVIPSVVEPEIVTLTLGRQILARDKLGVRVYVKKAQLIDVEKYDDFYVELKAQHFATVAGESYALTDAETHIFKYIPEGEEVPEGVIAQATETVDNIYFDYAQISAFEANLPMSFTIYCLKDGEVVAKTTPWTFSLASRLRDAVVPYTTGDSLTAYIDMINYCAEAQAYFASLYPDSDLAANLKEVGSPDAGFEAYDSAATKDEVMNIDMAETDNLATTVPGYDVVVGKGLQIQASNSIYFTVNPKAYDINSLTLVVEYVDSYGNDKTATVAVKDLPWDAGRQRYMYYADGDKCVALFDTGVKVSAKLYLDGVEAQIYTRDYSVESFIFETMKNQETQRPLGDAIMKFTYSLRKVLFPA